MNASAIYSKSGKGVQEASGKTSHLSRSDRAVLSAIDGRATLADVAQKVGKSFDAAFEKLIGELDKGGFIREVTAGTPGPAPRPAMGAKPAAKAAPTGPMDVASDLDFTTIMSTPGKSAKASPPPQAPPRATPAPAKHTATIPPPPPPPSAAEKAQAAKSAKEQQDAFAKAREEAERKAQADRDRVKAETEAKMRAETEAKLREEAEAKAKADAEKRLAAEAEAKIKAARETAVKAAAEAKARAEAEAKKAREEAERARKEAEEKAERARKEAEEKARREQEELRRKLEEERKAREEAERKAREEAKRLEEERRQLEEERKRREEEIRREEEERAARRKREQEEEERERAERAERKKREQEEEERERAEREARRKAKEQEKPKEEEKEPEPAKAAKEPEPAKAAGGGGFSDTLLADLESFTTRDEQEQKESEEAARKEKEAAAQRAREAEERRAKEEAERAEREEKERGKREAAERKEREEAELREREEREKRRLEEEEEKRAREAEEREKKAKQEERLAASAERRPDSYTEQAQLRTRRERELAAKPRRGAAARAEGKGWGKPIALTLFLVLLVALGVAHVIPIDVSEYQSAASEALRRPVKIGSANLSLVTGLQLKFHDVTVGDTKVGEVRAYPAFDALTGPKKSFSLIELEALKLDQQALGEALFTRVKGDNFGVARVVAKQLELAGPLAMPKGLEADLAFDAEGTLRSGFLRGPEALVARFAPKGAAVEVDMSASSFALPFAPEISLSRFSMKGTATPQGLTVSEWDGALLNGTVSGTASVRWAGENWIVEGVVTARNINAAVFAPALLSDGKGEGSGKFSMRGAPGKLAASSRLDGSFTVTRGVLGSIDLSRAIQTGGRQATGRTQFSEMNGQGIYDRGAVSLRNVTIGAGQLNAGASAEIAQNGALSGRIVADVRVASQTMRATLNLGGTLKEPQVRQ